MVLTVIGSFWLLKDVSCLNKDDPSKDSLYIVIWLFLSIYLCLTYALRIVYIKVFVSRRPISEDSNENVWADQVRAQVRRRLTEDQVSLIKKSKLSSYNELVRLPKAQVGHSKEILDIIITLDHCETVPTENETTMCHNGKLKQKEFEPSQGTCPICQENIAIDEWYKKLPQCQHCFHASCIDQWLLRRASCPVCREEIFVEEWSEESFANYSG